MIISHTSHRSPQLSSTTISEEKADLKGFKLHEKGSLHLTDIDNKNSDIKIEVFNTIDLIIN